LLRLYFSNEVDQLARVKFVPLQLARVGSIWVHASFAYWMSASDQLARLQLARSKSEQD
jgi:hypothetical protein